MSVSQGDHSSGKQGKVMELKMVRTLTSRKLKKSWKTQQLTWLCLCIWLIILQSRKALTVCPATKWCRSAWMDHQLTGHLLTNMKMTCCLQIGLSMRNYSTLDPVACQGRSQAWAWGLEPPKRKISPPKWSSAHVTLWATIITSQGELWMTVLIDFVKFVD